MQIEISNKDLAILAELVFMGELIVNAEREQEGNVIEEYLKVKEQIIRAYKSTLSKEWQAKLKKCEDEHHYFMSQVNGYLVEYEGINLTYILSEKLADIKTPKVKSKDFNIFEQINAWRQEFKNRFGKSITSGDDMMDFFMKEVWNSNC